MYKRLVVFAIAVLAAACNPCVMLPPAPAISFPDAPEQTYTLKEGRQLRLAPSYSDAAGATYSWTDVSGKLVATTPYLDFSATEAGVFYFTVTVTTEGGSASSEVCIKVAALDPPRIAAAGYERDGNVSVPVGWSGTITATVATAEAYTCSWSVDGVKVSSSTELAFTAAEAKSYQLLFEAENEDGKDSFAFMITAGGDVSAVSWAFDQGVVNICAGQGVLLRALDVEAPEGVEYRWSIGGTECSDAKGVSYLFKQTAQGEHVVLLEMMAGSTVLLSHEFIVNVCPPEGAFFRPAGPSSQTQATKVYEFLPAPGMFINEGYTATTMEEACQYAENQLNEGRTVSLGAWGGYIVVGFDHSIECSGEYNIAIAGNSFENSSEPGIVYVMQDANGNGLPDDVWYELRGSEYGKVETIQDYAVTYYRPDAPAMPVVWKDNRGGTSSIEYWASFHSQPYYYPAWVAEDSYTLRGTCLKSRTYDKYGNGSYWVRDSYEWGYADNYSKIDCLGEASATEGSASWNHFRISDAVTLTGDSAGLKYIDFIKVQTGDNCKAGWIGENSTEIMGIKDYNLMK